MRSTFGEENSGKFKNRRVLRRDAAYIGGGEHNKNKIQCIYMS